MAKKKAKAEEESQSGTPGQKVILPNGEARVDFIRERYYKDGVKRSDIVKELKEMDHEVPYQIVFAATKTKEMPVPKPRGRKSEDEDEEEEDSGTKKGKGKGKSKSKSGK